MMKCLNASSKYLSSNIQGSTSLSSISTISVVSDCVDIDNDIKFILVRTAEQEMLSEQKKSERKKCEWKKGERKDDRTTNRRTMNG